METNPPLLKVGAVIFPGFELLDIYGPLEMLGMLRERVSLVMLAETAGPVPNNQGPKGVADLALAEAKGIDILLIPGGWGTRKEVENTAFLDQLAILSAEAHFVASICTGSALLAKAGLLDGKKATSNKRAFDWVAAQGPRVTWIRQARWVEDGKFFTSSGASAGMDMTLGLMERLFGRETSLQVARWAEYTWNEDKSVDPFVQTPAAN